MTEPTDLEVTHAYSRQAVEEYLHGVEAQRRELEIAIAEARARTARATHVEKCIVDLEHRVGQLIVEAHVQPDKPADPPRVFTDAPVAATPLASLHRDAGEVPEGSVASTPPAWKPPPPPPPSGWEADRG